MATVCLALVATAALLGRPARAQEDLLGEIRTIAAVRFEGRHRVGARELRSVMKTRSSSRWPWREKQALRIDFLRSDNLAIRDRYLHHGFLDAHVGYRLTPSRDSSRVAVTFVIQEGERTRVAAVTFTGVHSHPEDPLRRKLLARPGQPFDPFVLQLDTLKISELYQERGFRPHVVATARRGEGADSLRVQVSFAVEEGPQYLVGEVYLFGYQKVQERLIRRELVLKRDDIYRRSRMVRSWERLYDTGLFSQVQISPIVDSTRSRMEFELRVRERKPRWLDAGVGSGSAERFRATGEWGHRNVFGRGFQGALATRVAFNGSGKFLLSRTELSLLEPWLLRTRTRAVVTPSYERSDDRADARWLVAQESRGVKFEVGREINRFSRVTLAQNNAWVHQDLTLFADTLAAPVRDSLERSIVARYSTHSIALGGVRDFRDNPLNATRGSVQALTGELAGGPLKGTSSFRKVVFVSSWYTPFANGWVLATRVRAGAIDPTGHAPAFSIETEVDSAVARVPLGDRFRTGGVNSVRGYSENSIPPSGGLALLQANAELRIPIAGPFGIELFVDAGNVWARPSYIKARDFAPKVSHDPLTPNEVRYVFGIGPRINLPIGPLRLDLTWSLRPSPGSSALVAKPQFAIGPSF
ncbi:MAG: BamA/TamA family outer membrane protein [Candidatus Eisenbacteria bacterium]